MKSPAPRCTRSSMISVYLSPAHDRLGSRTVASSCINSGDSGTLNWASHQEISVSSRIGEEGSNEGGG